VRFPVQPFGCEGPDFPPQHWGGEVVRQGMDRGGCLSLPVHLLFKEMESKLGTSIEQAEEERKGGFAHCRVGGP